MVKTGFQSINYNDLLTLLTLPKSCYYFMSYLLIRKTGYAARSLGTCEVENVHCMINIQDKRGAGTLSVEDVSRQMSNLQRLILLRKHDVAR